MYWISFFLYLNISQTMVDQSVANYDEAKVGIYSLPNEWKTVRKPEVLKLFQDSVYGIQPAVPVLRLAIYRLMLSL